MVDVVLNGEYKGVYQLCDHIDVDKQRVNIEENGGYFIEIDSYAYEEEPQAWFSSTLKRIPVTIKSPKDDEITAEQKNYIQSHFYSMEKLVFAENNIERYRRYIDMKTFVSRFLIQEIAGNPDAYWSVFLYKQLDNDAFYFSPVWDFDNAYDNDKLLYPTNNNLDWLHVAKGRMASGGVKELINHIFSDPAVYEETKSVYTQLRNQGIISEEALLAVVDDYVMELEEAAKLNFMRWDILNILVHENPKIHGSYEAEVDNVKSYIKNRLNWMDNKLAYIPSDIPQIVSSEVEEPIKVAVYTLTGNLVFSGSIKDNYSLSLSPGIYILRTKGNKTGYKTEKFIVQ